MNFNSRILAECGGMPVPPTLAERHFNSRMCVGRDLLECLSGLVDDLFQFSHVRRMRLSEGLGCGFFALFQFSHVCKMRHHRTPLPTAKPHFNSRMGVKCDCGKAKKHLISDDFNSRICAECDYPRRPKTDAGAQFQFSHMCRMRHAHHSR